MGERAYLYGEIHHRYVAADRAAIEGCSRLCDNRSGPEPGGITYKELLAGIAALQDLNQIVAADVVELSPQYDPSGASTAMACKTVREMLLTLTK